MSNWFTRRSLFNWFTRRSFRTTDRRSAARPSSIRPQFEQFEQLESRLTPAVSVVQNLGMVTIRADADADVVTIVDTGINRFTVQGQQFNGVRKINIISTAGIDVNYTGAAVASHLKVFDWQTSDGDDTLTATGLSAGVLNIRSKATEVGDDSFTINNSNSVGFFNTFTITTGRGQDAVTLQAGNVTDVLGDMVLIGQGELDVTINGNPKFYIVLGTMSIKANNLATTSSSDISFSGVSVINNKLSIDVNTASAATAATTIQFTETVAGALDLRTGLLADTITFWNGAGTFGLNVNGNATINTGRLGVADTAIQLDRSFIGGNFTLSLTAGNDSNVRIGTLGHFSVLGNALIRFRGGDDSGSTFGGAGSNFLVVGPEYIVSGGPGINTKPTIGANSTIPSLFNDFQLP